MVIGPVHLFGETEEAVASTDVWLSRVVRQSLLVVVIADEDDLEEKVEESRWQVVEMDGHLFDEDELLLTGACCFAWFAWGGSCWLK